MPENAVKAKRVVPSMTHVQGRGTHLANKKDFLIITHVSAL
jgi:hypothetical protein